MREILFSRDILNSVMLGTPKDPDTVRLEPIGTDNSGTVALVTSALSRWLIQWTVAPRPGDLGRAAYWRCLPSAQTVLEPILKSVLFTRS